MPDPTLQPIHRPDSLNPAGTAFHASPKAAPVLRVEGLIKIYGKRRVVDGVSFHVNHGEIVGLLGPNGAGKTTSFRMACGLIDTNGGIVYLDGQDVTNWPMYRRSREGGMGYLPQAESVFRNLSVQDNLLGVMEMLGIRRRARKARCDELLEKFKLTHLRRNRGSGLSGGERRRLEIARALVSDPKIILLDEPFAAIDPITVHSIQDIIRQLAAEGISILVTDHKERETLQITQRSYVIRSGRVLCHGTPEEVLANEEARKVYFGNDISIAGNSTVFGGIAGTAGTASASPSTGSRAPVSENGPGRDGSIRDGSTERLPFVRSRPRPVDSRRSVPVAPPTSAPIKQPVHEQHTPQRETESLPARPITHEAGQPLRPVARPAVRSAVHTTEQPAPEPKEAGPGKTGAILKAVHTFLWGGKR